MPAQFKLIYTGVGEMLREGFIRQRLHESADRIAAAAKANAPVESGSYRNSIHVEDDTTDRAVVRVVAGVPYAINVEAATGNLARALGSG
jgi:hypothetical protein